MPLVILTGFPLSGKSVFAEKLKDHLEKIENKNVVIVSDENCGSLNDKNKNYSDSKYEKELRSILKSLIHINLNSDSVVIFDSLNYIKGYRYELFCISKSRSTPQCTVYFNDTEELCLSRNNENLYSDNVLKELISRYEIPNGDNRWDSPLFNVNSELSEDKLLVVMQNISESILRQSKKVVPNKSTLNIPQASNTYLQDVEQRTQQVIKSIVSEQKIAPVGSYIMIANAQREKYLVKSYVTPAALQRSRRQFVSNLVQIHTNNSTSQDNRNIVDQLEDSFVDYLNRCC